MIPFLLSRLLDKSDQDWVLWKDKHPEGLDATQLQHFYRVLSPSLSPEVFFQRTMRLIELNVPLVENSFLNSFSLRQAILHRRSVELWLKQGVLPPWNMWADDFKWGDEHFAKTPSKDILSERQPLQPFLRLIEHATPEEVLLPLLIQRIKRDLQDLQFRVNPGSSMHLLRRKYQFTDSKVEYYTTTDALFSLQCTVEAFQNLLRQPSLSFDTTEHYHSEAWQSISKIFREPPVSLQHLTTLNNLRQIEERWALSLTIPKASCQKTTPRL